MEKLFEYRDLKILIAEDTKSMRDELLRILQDIGFKYVLAAENGHEAMKIFVREGKSKKPVDLIISDINMPKLTGIEFLKMVKSMSTEKDIPVIMVTTEAEVEKVLECVESGAAEYIIKPYKQKTILEKVANCCKKIKNL